MPRQPTPTPRERPITITRHARGQAARRGVSEANVRETIVHGREIATDEAGQKGGFISKFYKSFKLADRGTKTVVAVCEAFPDRYVLVTTYMM